MLPYTMLYLKKFFFEPCAGGCAGGLCGWVVRLVRALVRGLVRGLLVYLALLACVSYKC